MKTRKPFWVILCCNLFLSLTAAFFLPLEVILLNQKEFMIAVSVFWWFQLLLAVGAALILTGIMMLLPPEAGRIAAAVALAAGLCLWAQSMFMNGGMATVSGAELQTPASTKIVNILIWVLIFAAVLVPVILFARKKRKETETAMCLVAGALIVMQTVAFIGNATTADKVERETRHFLSTEGEFTLSSGNNVVEFILDTADEKYFNEMLERWPEMRQELAGWTYYNNTTSEYSRTYPAVPWLLTGEQCWFDRGYPQYVQEAYEKSNFLPRLHESGTDVRVYTMDPYLVGDNTGDYIANYMDFDYMNFGNLDLVQLEKNLLHISLFKGAPYILKNKFAYYQEWVNSSSFKFRQTDYSHAIDPVFYEEMNSRGVTATADSPSTFRFYHLMGTHPGVVHWNENLETVADWEPIATMKGSFKAVLAYCAKMKELGLYDNATIIVTADHGISGGGEETLDVTGAHTPLILVKYPKGMSREQNGDSSESLETAEAADELRINSAPVAHEDLFATIETALGLEPSGIGSGKTLRDYAENEDRRRLYYYTALYSDVDGEIALREYEINGDANDLANWQPTGNWWNIDYSVNKVSETRYTP